MGSLEKLGLVKIIDTYRKVEEIVKKGVKGLEGIGFSFFS